ncbi:MAG: hypothetical protein LBH53_00840, partial [Puniceicoccales bacterium]|nr:hypothetical protein [Puniceicoccales bacterium]
MSKEPDASEKLVPCANLLHAILLNPISFYVIELPSFLVWIAVLSVMSPLLLHILGQSCLRSVWRMTFQVALMPFRGL